MVLCLLEHLSDLLDLLALLLYYQHQWLLSVLEHLVGLYHLEHRLVLVDQYHPYRLVYLEDLLHPGNLLYPENL